MLHCRLEERAPRVGCPIAEQERQRSAPFALGVLHVLSADGTLPTLDVTVQSDTADTFGSPITALTFAEKSAAGSEAVANTTASADTWYRVNYELGGTTPDFSFVVVLGVQ